MATMHLFPEPWRDSWVPEILNSILQITTSAFLSVMYSAILFKNKISIFSNSSVRALKVKSQALLYFFAKVLTKCLSVKGSKITSYSVNFMGIFLGYESIGNNFLIVSH